MDYKEFCQRIGKLSMPEEIPSGLLNRSDSIHFVMDLGDRKENGCRVSISPQGMEVFLGAIKILEARDAVREKDFVVCCETSLDKYIVSLHTTTKYLSDEDFDASIRRMTL